MYNKNLNIAVKIAQAVYEKGGTAYYIGGYVRDRLRNQEIKDIDIEIHGIPPRQLEEILDSFGKRISIGESFGIYNLKGFTIDIAMPRAEEKRGLGHKDFDIFVDPYIGEYKAAKRRDFTINALMQNVLSGEILDYFGGIDDIKNGIIRHVDDTTFAEDPLRVLRAAQFAARFSYHVHPKTIELCRSMDLSGIAKERVTEELKKALLMSKNPSLFFETLKSMNQLAPWFNELAALTGIKQNPKYHAEGDAYTHTMMVLDCASGFLDKVSNPFGFMLSALAHDFGKAICTQEINGVLHSYNHETLGLPLVEAFIKRLTQETGLIKYVKNMCKYHMKPNILANNRSSIKSTNKMFDESVDPKALIYLAVCDGMGKLPKNNYAENEAFLNERFGVYLDYMSRPYVCGQDLINAGIEPSDRFKEYLEYAHKLRLAGVCKSHALNQTLSLAERSERKLKS